MVSCGYGQECTGEVGAQLLANGTGEGVTFACHAVTPYAVQATGVDCYLHGLTYGDRYFGGGEGIQGVWTQV